jgi:hypothetical protein
MATDDTIRRRSALLLDVTQAASEVSRLVHEARDLHLPVEPGVRDGRDSLVRWAVLLEEVIPPKHGLGSISPTRYQRPRHPAGPFRFHKEPPRLGSPLGSWVGGGRQPWVVWPLWRTSTEQRLGRAQTPPVRAPPKAVRPAN